MALTSAWANFCICGFFCQYFCACACAILPSSASPPALGLYVVATRWLAPPPFSIFAIFESCLSWALRSAAWDLHCARSLRSASSFSETGLDLNGLGDNLWETCRQEIKCNQLTFLSTSALQETLSPPRGHCPGSEYSASVHIHNENIRNLQIESSDLKASCSMPIYGMPQNAWEEPRQCNGKGANGKCELHRWL